MRFGFEKVNITINIKFLELCSRFLNKKALNELNKTTLIPSKAHEKSSSDLIKKWNDGERNLRFALAKLRADKMNKNFNGIPQSFPIDILQVARNAMEFESPMEAEKFLNNWRLEFLETLRPSAVSIDAILSFIFLLINFSSE